MKNELANRISDDDVETFQRDGVVCLRGVISLENVEALAMSIDDAVATLSTSSAGYDLTSISKAIEDDDIAALRESSSGQYNVEGIAQAIKDTGSDLLLDAREKNDFGGEGEQAGRGRFFLDTGVAARSEPFRDFALHGQCPEIASKLLRSETINFYDDQIFVKEPGTLERTAYHQDGSYFHFEGEQSCTIWIPVDPVAAAASVHYVRGSHRWNKFYKPNIFLSTMTFPGSEGDELPEIEGHEDEFDIVAFDMEPGDVLVHHHKTIHGAPGNGNLTCTRRTTGIRYTGEDIRYKFRPAAPQPTHLNYDMEDGDRLSAADFPLVWPRRLIEQVAA